ncbi:MAG TPA: hypothetical protein VGL40_00125 [Bacillota bacterium]|jgi:hypothetical protein
MNPTILTYLIAIGAAVVAVLGALAWTAWRARRSGTVAADERAIAADQKSASLTLNVVSLVGVALWLWDGLRNGNGDLWASPLAPLLVILLAVRYVSHLHFVWKMGGGEMAGVDLWTNGLMTLAGLALLVFGQLLGAVGMFIAAGVLLAAFTAIAAKRRS